MELTATLAVFIRYLLFLHFFIELLCALVWFAGEGIIRSDNAEEVEPSAISQRTEVTETATPGEEARAILNTQTF